MSNNMIIEPATLESANNMQMLTTLDIKLLEIGDTHAVVEVDVSEKHKNYMGGAHGGLLATIIDTVSFFPKPFLPSGLNCTTTNLNVNYVRPASMGDKLIARAEIVHLGKRTASVSVKVLNSKGKLVAHGTTTLMLFA